MPVQLKKIDIYCTYYNHSSWKHTKYHKYQFIYNVWYDIYTNLYGTNTWKAWQFNTMHSHTCGNMILPVTFHFLSANFCRHQQPIDEPAHNVTLSSILWTKFHSGLLCIFTSYIFVQVVS